MNAITDAETIAIRTALAVALENLHGNASDEVIEKLTAGCAAMSAIDARRAAEKIKPSILTRMIGAAEMAQKFCPRAEGYEFRLGIQDHGEWSSALDVMGTQIAIPETETATFMGFKVVRVEGLKEGTFCIAHLPKRV